MCTGYVWCHSIGDFSKSFQNELMWGRASLFKPPMICIDPSKVLVFGYKSCWSEQGFLSWYIFLSFIVCCMCWPYKSQSDESSIMRKWVLCPHSTSVAPDQSARQAYGLRTIIAWHSLYCVWYISTSCFNLHLR